MPTQPQRTRDPLADDSSSASMSVSAPTRNSLVLVILWLVLLEIYALIFWLDFSQPRGVLHLGVVAYAYRLWPLAAILICGIIFAEIIRRSYQNIIAAALIQVSAAKGSQIASVIMGVGVIASLAVVWALRAFPNSGDEYDYLFQAKTFLAGRLWNPVPPQHESFAFFWQYFRDGKWTTFYPPGWPLLLATVQAARLPAWLASPTAGGVLLFTVYRLGESRNGVLGGLMALILIALSPFFLFNAASYFMHVPAAVAGSIFCWAALKFLDEPSASRASLAGIALGVLGLIRPEDIPMFVVPFAIYFVYQAHLRHYQLLPALVISGLPFLVILLLYNKAVTGDAIPEISSFGSNAASFGLNGVDMFGQQRTPIEDLDFATSRIVTLAEWTSPFLLLAYAVSFWRIAVRRRLMFVDWVFPFFVIAYLFVPFFGGNQYGPRYYFEGYPFLVLTVASGITELLENMSRVRRCSFAVSMMMAHVGLCIITTAFIAIFMRTVIDERMDMYDQVAAEKLHSAIVIVRSSTGRLLPMFPKDLTRNGVAVDGDVLYALDIPGDLKDLEDTFRQRHFYVYERLPDQPKGALRPLDR